MLSSRPAARAAAGWSVAAVLAISLAACGGGGGGDPAAPPPPTPLPASLQLQTPPQNSALGTAHAFASNAADPSRKLSYRWDFGDGTTSTEAAPAHSFARSGVYTVKLTVTNEAGATVSSEHTVSISDLALVQGKSCIGGAGWCWQRPTPHGNPISDYHFIDAQRGWAVGEAGTVLSTNDGGLTWTPRASGTDLALNRVVFADEHRGWIAGASGHLLRTVDGGQTWTVGTTGRSDMIDVLIAYDGTHLWALSGGSYIASNDGGLRWTRQDPPLYSYYSSAAPGDFWTVVYDYTVQQTVLTHSTDGGVTWTASPLAAPQTGLSRYFYSVQFTSATHGWVRFVDQGLDANYQFVSQSRLLRTGDAGATWQPMVEPWPGTGYDANLRFVDGNVGYAWHGYQAAMKRTADGGATWTDVVLPVNASISSVKLFSAQLLTVRDLFGRVHFSADGGASWAVRTIGGATGATLNSVWFFNARDGMALGDDGKTLRTSDGGQTWTGGAALPAGGYAHHLQFLPDGSTGWLISNGSVLQSTDRGQTWTVPGNTPGPTLAGAWDFHFIDAQQGWAVMGSGWASGSVARTLDGGISWQPLAASGGYDLRAIRFADANHGIAVGAPGVALITSDGGATWQPRPTGVVGALWRVQMVDAQTAVAVGDAGTIVRSVDRGMTWTRIPTSTGQVLVDVRFVSAKTGWAVGDQGALLRTDDGGLSWTLQPTGTRWRLNGAFFLDAQTGWVVGANGTILVTATGGR